MRQDEDESDHAGFARAFRELRARHGFTIAELAIILQFSPQYISDLLSGRRAPSVLVCSRIAAWQSERKVVDAAPFRQYWHRLGARAHGWDV